MGAAECGDATLGGLRRREEQRADSGDMAEDKYLPELMAERDSLDPSFVHASQLLSEGALATDPRAGGLIPACVGL